jgi:hypothetical protein
MLHIRPEQFERLAAAHMVEVVHAYVRESFAQWCTERTDAEARRLVRDAVSSARAYGFEEAEHICQFTALAVAFGGAFDREHPWAAAVLADPRLQPPRRRMAILYDRAMEAAEPGP